MEQIPIRKSDDRSGGARRFVTQEKLDAYRSLQVAIEQRALAMDRLAMYDRIVAEAARRVEETE